MSFLAKAPTVLISGGSRGIGLAVALRLAQAGANITIAAKTATPHPKLPGTIYTAAEEIEKAGGRALPLVVDVRKEGDIQEAVEATVKKFGGIDIVINNASAISLTTSQRTSPKVYDLMNNINARGTYLFTKVRSSFPLPPAARSSPVSIQYAVPHLLESSRLNRNPHILTFSPPLIGNLTPASLGSATAYALAKFGMSIAALGYAGELQGHVGSNALWPLTYVSTEALRLIISEEERERAREPRIMADAAFGMLSKDGRAYSGNIEIDELFLRRELGYNSTQLATYANCSFSQLQEDLYIPQWVRNEIKALREADVTTANH